MKEGAGELQRIDPRPRAAAAAAEPSSTSTYEKQSDPKGHANPTDRKGEQVTNRATNEEECKTKGSGAANHV